MVGFFIGERMYSENDWRLYLSHSDEEIDKHKYGVPQQKKFPLPDADHVRSAIRFFNYVDPRYEKELASAIIRRMKEYGLSFDDFTVGDENRFKKYVPELSHHGIMGMKWGVQNGPPYPLDLRTHNRVVSGQKGNKLFSRDASATDVLGLPSFDNNQDGYKRIKNSSYANIEKWGRDKYHNVLYMTGISGSGKSTAAMYLAKKKNADYINLDSYFGMMSEESRNELQSKTFNKFLEKSVPNYKEINKSGPLDYKIVDAFAKALEDYGADQFGQGRKVIAEGVQISDETLYEHRSSYNGKPVMLINTNAVASNFRGSMRDSETLLDFADLLATRFTYSFGAQKTMKEFKKELDLKHGQNYSESMPW